MDKYEFKISLNEINALIGERRFEEAANIADGIDWNHVKSAETLCRISEVYKAVGDYDRSRDIMAIAHERETDNPVIVYALCELTIFLYGRDGLQSDLTSALQLMQEYQALEPQNPKRLILQYKMYCVSPVSDQEKIAILEQLHAEKATARWDFELAQLYMNAGEKDKASSLNCSIQQNYAGSKFAEKAAALFPAVQSVKQAPAEREDPAEDPAEAPAESAADAEEKAQAERTARELEQRAAEEKAAEARENSYAEEGKESRIAETETVPAKEPEAASQEPQADFRIRTPEEQHSVDSIQNNVAKGMEDIFARPYDEKLEQETNGQYSMVMDEPQEPEPQVEGQLSISEVMAEWEKIRSDIRRANDEKRAQRILEDTGSLMQDFDETARHGLLEDIEKGVARQRRQVRSGMYRVSDGVPARQPYGDPDRRREPVRRAYREEDAPQRPVGSREDGAAQKPAGPRGDEIPQRAAREIAPASEQDEDTRVYRRRGRDDMDDIATRRWNSEEIRRAMARQEQLAREEELRAAGYEEPEDEKPQAENYLDEQEETQSPAPAETAEQASPMKEEQPAEPEAASKVAPAEEEPYEEPEEEAPAEEYEETAEEEPYEEPAEEVPAEEALYEEPEEEALAEEYEETAEEVPEEEYEGEPAEEVPAEEEPYEESTEEAPEEEPAEEQPQEEPAPERKTVEKDAGRKPAPAKAGKAPKKPSSGGKRELTKEERRLFGPFCRMRENVEQLTEALDQISLASSTGNLLILGNEATADRVARGILEITRQTDSNFTGKVARVSGESLNKLKPEGIRKTFTKLESGALIINKASDLAPKTMERLYHELEGREHGIILILIDGNKKMEQFRHENEKYLGSFTAVISVRPLDDKALVAYAKDYAMSQDFSIDEFGQLALAQRIAAMQTSTHQVTLKEVRDLVDEAIGYAEKKTPHTLIEVISKRRYDENDRIIIHEKDFMHNM
ncbi:putative uncharacterized protein [Firmicutes bacterium CAG:791]|nr:putative uncharacterized protein [Firmicutes bacterium CAG:791]